MLNSIKTIRATFIFAIAALAIAFSWVAPLEVSNAATPPYELVVHVPGKAQTVPAGASVSITDASDSSLTATSRLVGKDRYGWFAVVSVPAGTDALKVKASSLPESATTIVPQGVPEIWMSASGAPALSAVAATGKLKMHLKATAKNMKKRAIRVSVAGKSKIYNLKKVGTDLVATAIVPKTAVSASVRILKNGKALGSWQKVNLAASDEIWMSDAWDTHRLTAAAAANKAVIHYHRADGNYDGWKLHTWFDLALGGGAKTPTTWENGLTPTASDSAWGVTWTVPYVADSASLPFIIHNGDTKDFTGDQLLDLTTLGSEVWIESGSAYSDGSVKFSVPAPEIPGVGPSLAEAAALVGSSERSAFANDNIYFVMTDRYANGDPSNDTGGLGTGSWVNGFDPTSDGYYHGGDFKGLTGSCTSGDGVARIKKMGFSAIWVTPPFVQNYVQGDSAAYHGYWINDFTNIDPHLGTNAEFKAFVDCAHNQGIKVIMDIVMNHTGDVNSYYTNGEAYVPTSAANLKKPSWLNDINNYHNKGDVRDWNDKFWYQNGDFFGLDDIKTENQVVIDGFAEVYSDWVNDYGIDGFRIDTAKHVDDAFLAKWWAKTTALSTTKPTLFAFGEVYDSNPWYLSSFVRTGKLPSVLDFNFKDGALDYASGGDATSLSGVFEMDDLYTSANTSAYNLATFLGNHDMGRVANLLQGKGVASTDLASRVLFAHDLMYLNRGLPVVYYGDEVGMIGSGGDKAARQDMFPTQVDEWKIEDRVGGSAIGNGTALSITNNPIQVRLTQLNALRKLYPALASGSQITRLAKGSNLVTSRIDRSDRREFVVAFNNGSTAQEVTIATSTPSSAFAGVWGATSSVNSDASGTLNFSIPANSSIVLRATENLPVATAAPIAKLEIANDANNLQLAIKAKVSAKDPVSVTFAARIGDGAWSALGTDDAGNFNQYFDYGALSKGTKVTIVAIVKTSSGSISISDAKVVKIP